MVAKTARAIDLYSGVGGWSLGLKLAGVDVVASYERWGTANETNFKNNSHQAQTVDIRRLSLEDLPSNIDIVVGSPPCTQFSYSNRGGRGDIADGMQDIIRFLAIVDHLKPRVWAMENVPRVAKIIEQEMQAGGVLGQFAHLGCSVHVIDMAEFGVPQRRKRCIAGNFDIKLLESFRATAGAPTLGDVVKALSSNPVVDPIYRLRLDKSELIDHVEEDFLSVEEVRINRANKVTHTVYNSMPFPDSMSRTVRTITATCTRVSRESIIIAAPGHSDSYRRLTLRERASLQGFPITFQFYGASYGQKLKMIGNAVPPAFSYLMGQVLQGRSSKDAPSLSAAAHNLQPPKPRPMETRPDRVGASYPPSRTFKFAVPSLQLKSGVRFELANGYLDGAARWKVAFYFGTSKAIHTISLDRDLARHIKMEASAEMMASVEAPLNRVAKFVHEADIANMQSIWAHKGPGGTRPFMLLDELDSVGAILVRAIASYSEEAVQLVEALVLHEYGAEAAGLAGRAKLARNAPLVLAGLYLGSVVNPLLEAKALSAPPVKQRLSAK